MTKMIPLGLKIILKELEERKNSDKIVTYKELCPILSMMIDLLNPANYNINLVDDGKK